VIPFEFRNELWCQKTFSVHVFVHVACDRGSVLLWRNCEKLHISGAVDDVIFSHNGPMARHVYS